MGHVGEVVERQLPALIDPGRRGTQDPRARCSSNPSLPVPDYTAAVDIHVMPGGFHTDITEDDVFAGALYDRGVHVFAFGGLGPLNDEMGVATATAVRRQFPDFEAPARSSTWDAARDMRRCHWRMRSRMRKFTASIWAHPCCGMPPRGRLGSAKTSTSRSRTPRTPTFPTRASM